ncbi:MAG: DUF5680 domain-containing protein [archaeon]|nr:DUF5680 domain-containing protein [archaeon]
MEKINKNIFVQFLQKAKKKTFASRISIPQINRDGSKEYRYREGPLIYCDKYFGSLVDTGQELVFKNQRLIWSMSYRGGMIGGYENLARRCFSFLKKSLRKVPAEFPIRGPQRYEKNEFRYENNWKGNLEDFIGEEKIFWKDKQIYFRNYFGGIGKPRKIE